MPITVIEGLAQNGTVEGVSVVNHIRQLETRFVRVTIEVIERPGKPGKEPHDQKESLS